MKKQNLIHDADLKAINEHYRQVIKSEQEYFMKKQNPTEIPSSTATPGAQRPFVPEEEAAQMEAIYEQYREAIEYHSNPDKLTFAQLIDTDNL